MITPAKAHELARLAGLLVTVVSGRQAMMGAALAGARARLRDAAQDLELAGDHLDLIGDLIGRPAEPARVPPPPV